MSTLLDTSRVAENPKTIQHRPWSHYSWLLAAFLFFAVCVLHVIRGSDSFGTYRASGDAAAHGMNPYAVFPATAKTHIQFRGKAETVDDINLNPPCVLPLFQLLSHLSYDHFGTLWTVGSLFFLLASIAILIWDRPEMQTFQILWLTFASSVFNTIFSAQIYFFLMLLSTLVWVLSKRDRELSASMALGLLVAIKPIVVFWPVFLFLSGRWRLALRSMFVTAVMSILPLALYGRVIDMQWLGALKGDTHWMVSLDIALIAEFRRFGAGGLGIAVAAVTAVGLALFVLMKKPNLEKTSAIALCAMLLCSPLAWCDYSLMLAPIFVSRRWSTLETVAAVMLMIGLPTAVISFSFGFFAGLQIAGLESFAGICIILGCYLHKTYRSTEKSKGTAATR
jgi:hypothetical protein